MLNDNQMSLEIDARVLIDKIKKLDKIWFHERHKARGLVGKEIPVDLQNLLHAIWKENNAKGDLSFNQGFYNFMDIVIRSGIKFSNPFLVIFYENRYEETRKLFDKTYTL